MEAIHFSNQNLWPEMFEVQGPSGIRFILREASPSGKLEGAGIEATKDRGGQAK